MTTSFEKKKHCLRKKFKTSQFFEKYFIISVKIKLKKLNSEPFFNLFIIHLLKGGNFIRGFVMRQ